MGYNSVLLGRVYSPVSLSVWLLSVVRLEFTDKIRLTGREMLLCLCWLLFQKLTAVKQAKFGAAKNFTVVHTQSLYATLLRAFSQLGENSSEDTSVAHFSKILRCLCLILSWKAVVKSRNNFNNNLRQGLLFLYVYFLFSIFHLNRPKKHGKESRVLKKANIFCAKDLIHTVGNKWDHNKALLKIWRESDKRAILFFQTKKRT